ncbi:MAG: riboflavin synthase [Candidatus Omnitrophica bacterium]|nr:riboflavin synthase [Candidatus Omnitrophota bacterium]
MFTGLIEELGEVKLRKQKNNILILGIQGKKVLENSKIGDSISVDGVCLTVSDIKNKILHFDVMAETLKISTLRDLRIGNRVNLERALKVEDRFGGHFVTGHIDGKGEIMADSQRLRRIAIPSELTYYIVPKGSIAVDGISLTVVEVEKNYFTISLIPYTLGHTTLGMKRGGDRVNIELDILAKYVAKLKVEKEKQGDYLKELLRDEI